MQSGPIAKAVVRTEISQTNRRCDFDFELMVWKIGDLYRVEIFGRVYIYAAVLDDSTSAALIPDLLARHRAKEGVINGCVVPSRQKNTVGQESRRWWKAVSVRGPGNIMFVNDSILLSGTIESIGQLIAVSFRP